MYESVWVRNLFVRAGVDGTRFLEGVRVDLRLDHARTSVMSALNVLGLDVSVEPGVYKCTEVWSRGRSEEERMPLLCTDCSVNGTFSGRLGRPQVAGGVEVTGGARRKQ